MSLPSFAELDEMTGLIVGDKAKFLDLGPEARIQVIGLVSQNAIVEALGNLDHELTKVGEWFKASRVYDGN